ncbi:DDE-type integrase/transposase/recombinase [Pseudoalteromonas sp.]|uniref:DDE-type integrase/transposase/recombinase n=1 Tax=Pseudoalteromonas sp. TaxID=53249 RepID=UPI001BCFAA7F
MQVGITIDADLSLPAEPVIRSLNQIIEWRGKPKAIKCDNGPEYISKQLAQWALNNDIELKFIQPNNLQQNACIVLQSNCSLRLAKSLYLKRY